MLRKLNKNELKKITGGDVRTYAHRHDYYNNIVYYDHDATYANKNYKSTHYGNSLNNRIL